MCIVQPFICIRQKQQKVLSCSPDQSVVETHSRKMESEVRRGAEKQQATSVRLSGGSGGRPITVTCTSLALEKAPQPPADRRMGRHAGPNLFCLPGHGS